ncbi:hypothetical protein E2C01_014141 [Portunus trituberculatus]|uniref:Uncharacterized protein n=1 Tax=Portunus trituberculatus TaxID=210409 RepID=A0A5B7DJ49_PORTR|nr:hypothetical protein [Portunus trituberculatus]
MHARSGTAAGGPTTPPLPRSAPAATFSPGRGGGGEALRLVTREGRVLNKKDAAANKGANNNNNCARQGHSLRGTGHTARHATLRPTRATPAPEHMVV